MGQKWVEDYELLELLYNAAGQSSEWQDFLVALSARTSAPGVAILFHCPEAQQYEINMQYGLPADSLLPYAEHYGKFDPWRKSAQMSPIGTVGLGTSTCPTRDFVKTVFYNEFLLKYRPFMFQAGLLFEQRDNGYGVLSCLREPQQDDFCHETTQSLQRLFPHLRWALQIHRKMVDYKRDANLGKTVLNSLDVGLIGVAANGRISFSNQQADSILEFGELLSTKNGKLVCRDSRQEARLRQLWCSVNAREIPTIPGGALTLRRGSQALHVMVLPWLDSDNAFSQKPSALLILIDPTTKPHSRRTLMQKMFQLTTIQTEIGMLLMGGLQSKEIAARLGFTHEDVRYHLSQIYKKTNVEGQSQLVRLMSLLPGDSQCTFADN